MSLQGKCAVVTGGGRGIGRAVCLELARQGASVLVNYSGSADAAEQTAAECRALGVDAEAVKADVSDPEQAAALIDAAMKRFGRVDILVINAGITRDGLALRMKEEDFDRVIETNLKGTFLCMKAAARPMMKQRSGRIINLASVVAQRGNAGQAN